MDSYDEQYLIQPSALPAKKLLPLHMDPTYTESVDEHYEKLYCFAFSLTRNQADAADLTQQAYLKLAKKWQTVRDYKKIKTWLFSTLYREFVDRQRRQKRVVEVEIEAPGMEAPLEVSASEVTSLDCESALRELNKLEPSVRIPLVLYYLQDCSYREIASTLSIPIGTVMSRLHRGRNLLRDHLTASSEQPSNYELQASGV